MRRHRLVKFDVVGFQSSVIMSGHSSVRFASMFATRRCKKSYFDYVHVGDAASRQAIPAPVLENFC